MREAPFSGNPITQVIAYLMEDPVAREARFSEHVTRMLAGCERFKSNMSSSNYTTDSWRGRQLKADPGFQALTVGKGPIQKTNSVDGVLAFHSKF